jgi:hypothetical protein
MMGKGVRCLRELPTGFGTQTTDFENAMSVMFSS